MSKRRHFLVWAIVIVGPIIALVQALPQFNGFAIGVCWGFISGLIYPLYPMPKKP